MLLTLILCIFLLKMFRKSHVLLRIIDTTFSDFSSYELDLQADSQEVTILTHPDFGTSDIAFFADGYLTKESDPENIRFTFVGADGANALSVEMDPNYGRILVQSSINPVSKFADLALPCRDKGKRNHFFVYGQS